MYNTVCLRAQILSTMTCQATPSYIKVNCEFTVISRREDVRLIRKRWKIFIYIIFMYFFYYLYYSYYVDIIVTSLL